MKNFPKALFWTIVLCQVLLYFFLFFLAIFSIVFESTSDNCYDCTFGFFEWCLDEDEVGYCGARGDLEKKNCTRTCEEEETPCLLGVYFWSAHLCDHITFFVVQVIGAIFLYFGTCYVLYCSFYDRQSPGSSLLSEPLDSSNSQFCPLCGCLWRNPPSFFSGFLRFVTPPSNPLALNRPTEEEEEEGFNEINTNEIDTTPPVEIVFCPFHDFRDLLQFYGSSTLLVTSHWFFTWQSANPLEDFGSFLFFYSILVYLPFLYFWFQCSRKVEYQIGDAEIHNARERTARVILNLSHLAEEEILAVGQPLIRFQPFAKKETGMYISRVLKAQIFVLGGLYFFFVGWFIFLHSGAFLAFYAMFAVLPLPYQLYSCFSSEKIFTIPIACSSSQCLIFIRISFDSIEVVSMSQVELSDKLFLVGFPSPDKVQLVPCTKIGNWDLASSGGGNLNWKKNEYQRKVLPSIDIFPSVYSTTSYLQFQGDEIAKKFRDSWFRFSPECRNLPPQESCQNWFALGCGAIALVLFGLILLLNWSSSFPSIPLLIFSFFGVFGNWIFLVLERFDHDDDLPVWTHLASRYCKVVV